MGLFGVFFANSIVLVFVGAVLIGVGSIIHDNAMRTASRTLAINGLRIGFLGVAILALAFCVMWRVLPYMQQNGY